MLISVFFRDKSRKPIIHKDIPESPFGEHGNMVSYWTSEKDLSVVPMDLVSEIVLTMVDEDDGSQKG